MGALPSAKRNVQRKTAAGDDVSDAKQAGTPLDPLEVSFEIEMLTGGTTISGEPSHRVLWRDNHEYQDWWQEVPEGIDVSGDDYIGHLVRIFNPGQAPRVSAGNAPQGTVLCVVLAAHQDGEDNRLCHEPETDSALKAARDAWDRGKFIPTLQDAMDILRVASPTIQEQRMAPEARQAMVLIALFLVQPTVEDRMIIRGHSEAVRRSFLTGGLLYDALTCMMSLEATHVREMASLAKDHWSSDPAAALFNSAQAHGKL
jgi:hypothetical protein